LCVAVLVLSTVAVSQTPVADPGARTGLPSAGDPIPGLTSGELNRFTQGKDAFEEVSVVSGPGDVGLGPRFNSDSCVSCHAQPAVGGTSPAVNPQIAVATSLGGRNQIPWFLSQNGPAREVRFIRNPDGTPDGGVHNLFVISGRSDAPGCNIQQESFANRSNLTFRIPTPVFGGGLMEAIPENVLNQNLAANAGIKSSLGIKGRLNRNDNTGTITRFGWKAQVASLQIFAGEAYNVEQGVSNPVFPQERDETNGCRFNATPEDGLDFASGDVDDVTLFAAFMRFLAPPIPAQINGSVLAGLNTFNNIGCALCHTAALRTGNSTVQALRNKPVPLFSDLAIHHMGPGLADGVSQGRATGDEFRTAPLWGIGKRLFFLHDGRATTLTDAIKAHASQANGQYPASEANAVIQRFNGLPATAQQNILNFLRAL
jgi:CxxC motif-containing protein (DUF1111 family)